MREIATIDAKRERSILEIARVVRSGGSVGILDIAHVSAYARVLKKSGWTITRVGITPWIFPPARELIGRKPVRTSQLTST